ncbi:MAG TPA: cytochrome c [Gaiellaceae bacterium]|nr:cytochrome c [Gaiellaceae bacterium]
MKRPHVLAATAVVLLAGGLAAGCGSQGTAAPTAQTVVGTLPTSSTPTNLKGNPANGKTVFATNGCASCHTYAPAGANGKVGPDLDKLADYATKANQPLQQFTSGAITSPPPSYVPPGFPTNVMPTNFGQTLTPQQLADLVAFLTQKS